MRAILPFALTVATVVCLAGPAAGWGKKKKEKKAQEVDHVALAAVLIKDGHHDRAKAVLEEIDPENEELEIDRPRYHMLMGLVYLEQRGFAEAQRSFEKAVAAGGTEPVIYVFMAQALFGQEKDAETIAALDKAGEAAASLAGTFLIRAQAHWRMEDRAAAFEDLERGLTRHPGDRELMRYRVFSLVEMGLFQQALEEGRTYLATEEAGVEDYAALGEALTKGGDTKSAILLLEEARLRFDGNEKITLQLARAYMGEGRTLTAARLLHSLARSDRKLTLDAAELYRRAGRLSMALALNADVVDQEAKIRQRLGILIEQKRYEEAAGLEPRLSRLGLLGEDAVRYALAFALFEIGRFDEAEEHLSKIVDSEIFQKASGLRRAMERCSAQGWECR